MHKPAIQATVAAAVLLLCATAASAQQSKLDPKKPQKESVETKAVQGKAADAPTGAVGQIQNSVVEPSATRAGPYSCDIHIDNRTNWYINRVYVDRTYRGSVGRYGDGYVRDVESGGTRLYAEADFTDGSTRHWGPIVFQCNAWGSYTWTLNY